MREIYFLKESLQWRQFKSCISRAILHSLSLRFVTEDIIPALLTCPRLNAKAVWSPYMLSQACCFLPPYHHYHARFPASRFLFPSNASLVHLLINALRSYKSGTCKGRLKSKPTMVLHPHNHMCMASLNQSFGPIRSPTRPYLSG